MYHDPMSKQQPKSSPSLIHTPSLQRSDDPMKTKAASASRHLLQLSTQLGNQQFGKWLGSQTNPSVSNTIPVIQRARFLSRSNAEAIGEAIQNTLSAMEEEGDSDSHQYEELTEIYNNFDAGSLATETVEEIRALTQNTMYDRLDELDTWMESLITGNVRNSNYPSSYSQAAQQALLNYKNNHQNPADATECLCSNCMNYVAKTDMTIDHVTPVAQHWNTIGNDTDRATRHAWYSDVNNHEYVCRSCNSSMGSGGVRYNMAVGPNYSG